MMIIKHLEFYTIIILLQFWGDQNHKVLNDRLIVDTDRKQFLGHDLCKEQLEKLLHFSLLKKIALFRNRKFMLDEKSLIGFCLVLI